MRPSDTLEAGAAVWGLLGLAVMVTSAPDAVVIGLLVIANVWFVGGRVLRGLGK